MAHDFVRPALEKHLAIGAMPILWDFPFIERGRGKPLTAYQRRSAGGFYWCNPPAGVVDNSFGGQVRSAGCYVHKVYPDKELVEIRPRAVPVEPPGSIQ
jgi:hypothetical protein